MTGECQRKGCGDTATTSVEWLEVSDPLEYCQTHARLAVQMFPDLATLPDGEQLPDSPDGVETGGETA